MEVDFISAFENARTNAPSCRITRETIEVLTLFSQRCIMYQSNRSFNILPPRAYPGHLTSFPAREGGNLINLVFPGAGI